MILIKEKPDVLGTLASSLCLIHCIATPFIFIAKSCSASCCSATPLWWRFIDYLFLVISFAAIYWTTKSTTLSWIKPILWCSWFMLFIIIINEKIGLLSLPDTIIYVPAISLVMLHLYNKKYCNCENDKCCVNEG